MEANKMMVGDWYYDTDLNKKRQWHQLQFGEAFGDPTYHMAINPIPLTEEMLKVNGFEIVDGWDCLYLMHGNIVFDYEHSTLNYILHDLAFPICDLTYVHELQHALRLCGLNELADNFKVE